MSGSGRGVTSLTRSALSGTAWNYAGAAVLVVAQILSTAATARLVAPREFGLYATAQAAAGIFGYFTLSAVGQGLLRRARLGPRAVGTAQTISLTSGAAVALLMWLLAGPWSDVWRIPDAAPLVRVMAVTLFLVSSSTVPLALLRHALRFRAAAGAEVGSQLIGITAGVLLAVQMHSAMALVIGQTIAAGALLVSTSMLTRRDLRVDFTSSEARELTLFAGQVGLQNIGFFTLYTAPGWVIARLFGASALGIYSRANLIVGLPLNYLTTGLIKVMYPFYGRLRSEVLRARTLLTESITIATGFSWVLFALVAGASPVIVELLLGPKWHDASTMVRLCALIACANLPWVLLGNSAEAFGWMRLVWFMEATYACVLGAAFLLVHFAALGLNAVLLGAAAAQWIAYALLLTEFARRGLVDSRMVLEGHIVHIPLALCTFAVAAICARVLADEPLAIQLIGQSTTAVAVAGVLIAARSWIPCSRTLEQRLALVAADGRPHLLSRLGVRPS